MDVSRRRDTKIQDEERQYTGAYENSSMNGMIDGKHYRITAVDGHALLDFTAELTMLNYLHKRALLSDSEYNKVQKKILNAYKKEGIVIECIYDI
jgi:hypothetical protein